ncbi:MAG: ABC transporter substrate-binding protein [Actinomycetota bacterium]
MAATAAVTVAVAMLPSTATSGPGVSRRQIKIGLHAPLTGAVPLPSGSVDRAARVFWRWLRVKDQPINGRHVRVFIRNDQANPSTAVAVCKEMVEDDNVFLLAGTLQSGVPSASYACARYAESVGVPYVGLGGPRSNLRLLQRYFALTATYRRQAELLADMFVDRLSARRRTNGVVWIDDPLSSEAHSAFVRVMEAKNADIDYDRSVPRTAGTVEARTIVEEMRLRGVDNVFFFHTPIFFLNVLKQANTQDFEPTWTGIGPGIGGNDQVVNISCNDGDSIDGARFLSALPAFDDRNEFDRSHDRAMNSIYPEASKDDVTWLGWATSKAIKRMLEAPGRRLTRARFGRVVERSQVRTGILPKIRFRPSDHFGGRGVHMLRASCSDRRWHTAGRFITDF